MRALDAMKNGLRRRPSPEERRHTSISPARSRFFAVFGARGTAVVASLKKPCASDARPSTDCSSYAGDHRQSQLRRHRLLSQVERILDLNRLQVATTDVVEAVRESLVIRQHDGGRAPRVGHRRQEKPLCGVDRTNLRRTPLAMYTTFGRPAVAQ